MRFAQVSPCFSLGLLTFILYHLNKKYQSFSWTHVDNFVELTYYNVSLVKTRLRAFRRGEIPSPVGVRQPNPYENVRIFLEFAIYQTHVIICNKR